MSAERLPRSLSELEVMLGEIYNAHDRQFYPSRSDLALKLVWAIGVFSSAERKERLDKIPAYLADSFAWWVALCNFCEFSVEEVLWLKFPQICYYCGFRENCQCEGQKNQVRIPEEQVQKHRESEHRPETMREWQQMLDRIYGKANAVHGFYFAMARLPEELSEMIECIQPMLDDRQKLMLEMADVGARIFALASLLKIDLQEVILARYPGHCPSCHGDECFCDPRKGAPA